mgnify:CR=1 FL=1
MHKKYFIKDTNNIIDTKDLINLSTEAVGKNNWQNIADISKSLIIVKSIRALTSSINKNSKTSTIISIIWLLLTCAITFLWFVELWIELWWFK